MLACAWYFLALPYAPEQKMSCQTCRNKDDLHCRQVENVESSINVAAVQCYACFVLEILLLVQIMCKKR